MSQAEMSESARLARTVSATEAVCALPAIGTQDWCDRAAAAIAVVFPQEIVGLAVVEVDHAGAVLRLEAMGVAGPDGRGDRHAAVRRRFDTAHHLGWTLGDPSTWRGRAEAGRVQDQPQRSWGTSDGARHWSSIGVNDVLAGAAVFVPERPGRLLVVEAGRSDGKQFEPGDAWALSAVLTAAARKALLAFGVEPISPARMLTPREQEVLEHLALGRSVKEIASRLSRSPHTVHDYVKALHRKLQASSRGALIAKALGHTMTESTVDSRSRPKRSANAG